jgi:uncharacterized protein YbgA (DUF1722 family)
MQASRYQEDFIQKLEEVTSQQKGLNKILHEQGDEINRIMQTNEQVFKHVS